MLSAALRGTLSRASSSCADSNARRPQEGALRPTPTRTSPRTTSIDVHGLADFYFQKDLARSAPGTAEFRAFDVWTNLPSASLVRLTIAHRPGTFGFRLDAGSGDTLDAYFRSDPASLTYPTLSRWLSHVEQGFVTVVLPLGRGLSLDLGKFATPIGLEDNESLAAWNYSRSLLFTLGEPTFHAGLRLTYPIREGLGVSLFWLNGWNSNVVGGDGMRSFAGAVSWKPSPSLEAVLEYIGGLERPPTDLGSPLALRNELSTYATYQLTPAVGLALAMDYGLDASSGGVRFWGVAGYARVRIASWLCVGASLRALRRSGGVYDRPPADGDGGDAHAREPARAREAHRRRAARVPARSVGRPGVRVLRPAAVDAPGHRVGEPRLRLLTVASRRGCVPESPQPLAPLPREPARHLPVPVRARFTGRRASGASMWLHRRGAGGPRGGQLFGHLRGRPRARELEPEHGASRAAPADADAAPVRDREALDRREPETEARLLDAGRRGRTARTTTSPSPAAAPVPCPRPPAGRARRGVDANRHPPRRGVLRVLGGVRQDRLAIMLLSAVGSQTTSQSSKFSTTISGGDSVDFELVDGRAQHRRQVGAGPYGGPAARAREAQDPRHELPRALERARGARRTVSVVFASACSRSMERRANMTVASGLKMS